MKFTQRLALAAAASLITATASAGGYIEGPDLSDNHLAPTPVPVELGSNIVAGTMGFNGPLLDRDFFKITVPEGAELVSIVLGASTVTGGGSGFIAMSLGPVLTVDPLTVTDGSPLLGWHLYRMDEIGQDILAPMGEGPGKIGFSGPLPAGTYTFWVQELEPAFPGEPFPPYPFEFDLRIQAIPEPASLLLMAGGVLALAARRRHAARRAAPAQA